MMQISYAQNFEDIMLWRALREVKKGFYIDVGSHHPVADSVTHLFYEKGWCGINIDPNPISQPLFQASRKRDINLELAVTDKEGEIELQFNETGLSSIQPDLIRSHVADGFRFQTKLVKCLPLAKVWDAHVPAGQDVHFLKIDVEGAEESVLKSADFARHRPWIVVLEATLARSQTENWQAWEPLLTSARYSFVYADGLNRFYLAQEHEALRPSFRFPPNIFDDFVQARGLAGIARSGSDAADNDTKFAELEQALRDANIRIAALEDELKLATVPMRLIDRLLLQPNGRPRKWARQTIFENPSKR